MLLLNSLPCDEELVNLRHVRARTSLLIRRKLGFSCNIRSLGNVGRCVPHVEVSVQYSNKYNYRLNQLSLVQLISTEAEIEGYLFSPSLATDHRY